MQLELDVERVQIMSLQTEGKRPIGRVQLILLWLFLGMFGVQRFIAGYTGLGILYLFTGAGGGIFGFIDGFLILTNRYRFKAELKASDGSGRNMRFVTGILGGFAIICSLLMCLAVQAVNQETQKLQIELTALAEAGTTATPRPRPVFQTARGSFSVGDSAYMDGTNSNGDLIVPNINVWQNNGSSRGSIICEMRHRMRIQITSINISEGILYFKVDNGRCEGWVSELFVSEE